MNSENSTIKKTTYRSLQQVVFMTLTYNLSSFYFGYSMVYFNGIQFSKIKDIFQLYELDEWGGTSEGILTGCLSFGALFGALFSSKIISYYTRTESIHFGNILACIGGIMILFENWLFLMVGRILQGFCVGFFSALTPIMVKQMVPIELSGPMGAFLSPSIAIGFMLAYLFPYLFQKLGVPPSSYWRLTFGFSLLTIGIQTFLIKKFFNFQSPKYLLSKGKKQESMQIIKKIYKTEYCESIYEEKMIDIGLRNDGTQLMQGEEDTNQHFENQKSLKDREDQSLETQLPHNSPLAIFFAFCLPIFQQLSGINVIITFGSELVEKSFPSLSAELPLIVNGQKLIVAFIAIAFLEKFGRKKLLLIGSFLVAISLLLLFIGFQIEEQEGTSNQKLILFSFIFYISAFVPTMGPITWLYMSEIVQPTIMPYTVMSHWIMACLIVTIYPIIRQKSENPSCPQMFLFFSCCTFIYCVIITFLMVQTKGKNQFQIRSQFQEKQRRLRTTFR